MYTMKIFHFVIYLISNIKKQTNVDIDINSNWEQELAKVVIDEYKPYYKELERNEKAILEVLANEKNKFNKILDKFNYKCKNNIIK